MKMTQREKNTQKAHECKFLMRKEHGEGRPTLSIEDIEELIGIDPIFFTLSDITYVEEVRMDQAMKHDFIK